MRTPTCLTKRVHQAPPNEQREMSRNAALATVGGALFMSALERMEANAVRETRRNVMRRVDHSVAHARHHVARASTTATLLVGAAVVAYVVNDHRRARVQSRARELTTDLGDRA